MITLFWGHPILMRLFFHPRDLLFQLSSDVESSNFKNGAKDDDLRSVNPSLDGGREENGLIGKKERSKSKSKVDIKDKKEKRTMRSV